MIRNIIFDNRIKDILFEERKCYICGMYRWDTKKGRLIGDGDRYYCDECWEKH